MDNDQFSNRTRLGIGLGQPRTRLGIGLGQPRTRFSNRTGLV